MAKDTKGKRCKGWAVRARKAHVRPGGLWEHGGLRTPCFGEGGAASYMSYWSYSSYRGASWHVADVLAGAGESGSLEAWMLGFLIAYPVHSSPRRGVLFSVAVEGLSLRACTLRSLFSGARLRAPFPCRGVGRGPTKNANQPISQSANQLNFGIFPGRGESAL